MSNEIAPVLNGTAFLSRFASSHGHRYQDEILSTLLLEKLRIVHPRGKELGTSFCFRHQDVLNKPLPEVNLRGLKRNVEYHGSLNIGFQAMNRFSGN